MHYVFFTFLFSFSYMCKQMKDRTKGYHDGHLFLERALIRIIASNFMETYQNL